MHQLMIYISVDLAFTETAKDLGHARKRAKEIARNGYEIVKPDGTMVYPSHRIERIDIMEIPVVTAVQEKKEEEEQDD